MQHKKPFSAKQRKAQLQQKRAIKRGDISPPQPSKPDRHKKVRRGVAQPSDPVFISREVAAESSRRLQSSFIKLPQEFLEKTRQLAASIPLKRPLLSDAALSPTETETVLSSQDTLTPATKLTCPRRPKWRYEMSKKEVERNEEGLFRKWLDQTDEIVYDWCDVSADTSSRHDIGGTEPVEVSMPRAPTTFERNLEVWRQLWRVTEISQIILVLLDSRCPLLHFPPSLSAYLSSPQIANHIRTILVLTKVDITGSVRADEWTRFFKTRYPRMPIVRVESYVTEASSGDGAGQSKMHQPYIPPRFRQLLVQALQEAHAELLEPPDRLKDSPERLANWKPSIRTTIAWDAMLHAKDGQVGTVVGGPVAPQPHTHGSGEFPDANADDDGEDGPESEPEYLTIGLIGQPNVGKSSLLNALFGVPKVKASRTPGKTKHFQTLFWTPEVRLVDCPGLVMPNLVPMEIQVLSGILPISRISAIALCIYHASRLMPLEIILNLTHPSITEHPPEDKRTWREPRASGPAVSAAGLTWTAMDTLTAYALKKGWVTAKAGRPDVNRAGNAILRLLAEGKINWGFWPGETPKAVLDTHIKPGHGIWISQGDGYEAIEDEYTDDDQGEDLDLDETLEESGDPDATLTGHDDTESELEPQSGDTGTALLVAVAKSRFAALSLDVGEGDDDSDG